MSYGLSHEYTILLSWNESDHIKNRTMVRSLQGQDLYRKTKWFYDVWGEDNIFLFGGFIHLSVFFLKILSLVMSK